MSRTGFGIRIFITQSDLLNVLYAAYSRNNASMFIINNCCITFGILHPCTLNNTFVITLVITVDYISVFTIVNTNINTRVSAGVMAVVGTGVNRVFVNNILLFGYGMYTMFIII